MALSSNEFMPFMLAEDRLQEFGCESSIDAYSLEYVKPTPEQAGNLRTTGAHIHVGIDGFDLQDLQRFILCMDKMVGIPSLELDNDTTRRQLYGKAGECRYKQVGSLIIIEYRTLGGGIVTSKGIPFMFNATQEAIELFNTGYEFSSEETNNQQILINTGKNITENV